MMLTKQFVLVFRLQQFITRKLELTVKDAQSYKSHQQAFTLCTKVMVDVVSLSVFGGNFVLAGTHQCPFGVERCPFPVLVL